MVCASHVALNEPRRPVRSSHVSRVLLAAPDCHDVMPVLVAYVAEHYASRVRMEDLARHCHVSVRTLQNVCHAHCGEPPLKALRRFRLQKLHAVLADRPWQPLVHALNACGLTGSTADRDLFQEMYALSMREHQQACRCQG